MAAANSDVGAAIRAMVNFFMASRAPPAHVMSFETPGGPIFVMPSIVPVGGGDGGQPPASKASIESLKVVEIGDAGEECAVCLEGLAGLEGKEMPCGHRYHKECIEKWLGLHGSCPMCRFQMPAEEAKGAAAAGEGEGARPVMAVALTVILVERRQQRSESEGGVEDLVNFDLD